MLRSSALRWNAADPVARANKNRHGLRFAKRVVLAECQPKYWTRQNSCSSGSRMTITIPSS